MAATPWRGDVLDREIRKWSLVLEKERKVAVMLARHETAVPPTPSSPAPHRVQQPIGLLVGLILIVIGMIAGAAYGIVQMQRGIDAMYAKPDGPLAPLPTAVKATIVGNPVHGRELFNMSCYVCHGPTGSGVPGLGAPLQRSKFVAGRSDPQLITFIKMGRQPGDPNTVSNGTMPPKGGNPLLDDAGLQDVVAFIRTLQVSGS